MAKLKLRYVEHHVIRMQAGRPKVEFAGVWVHGPDVTRSLDYAYLPGFPDQEERANEIVNGLVEDLAAGKALPEDILERIASGGYWDAWGTVEETDAYGSIRELEAHCLAKRGLRAAG